MEPQTHTSELAGYNLLTYGDYQFAVWYTLANELRIGRIQRGVQTWGVDHDEYEFAGTPRTVLDLPVSDDVHNYPTVAVDNRGFLHVWAAMHDDTMHAVKSTTAHTTGDWLATAGWVTAASDFPSLLASSTYPVPVRFDDGGLLFFIRDGQAGVPGGSGKCDTHFYRRSADGTAWEGRTKIFQGLLVPDAGGTGVAGADHPTDDVTNWSAYPTVPVVESSRCPHPGRLHMSWVWRVDQDATLTQNIVPSYAYSDDRGVTWAAIDGTALTLPFTPLNNHAARIPAGSANVTAISRSSNVVSATLDTSNHGIGVGQTITVYVQDTGYNGTFTVLTAGNPVTWAQTAADDASGGVGSVSTRLLDNWGSLTIDDDGQPHILCSTGPSFYMHYQGQWVVDQIGATLAGLVHQIRPQAMWIRGHLWMLKTQGVSTFRRWYPQLWRLLTATSSDVTFRMGGPVNSFGQWEPSFDPEAYRRFGTIEVLTPDGNHPRVVTFGKGPRALAA